MWRLALLWLACGGEASWIVEGTVVEVRAPDQVVIDHEEIPGLMGPMVMPFAVRDASLLDGLAPGDRVLARYHTPSSGSHLSRIRVVGKVPLAPSPPAGPAPLRAGEQLPALILETTGGPLTLGRGADGPTLLTFIYTRCPVPEFCPATVARLQALQPRLQPPARIVAVTLDPDHDTLEVLGEYGAGLGAESARWVFARTDTAALDALALRAGLVFSRADPTEIVHAIRVLVLDGEGRLVERYDDNRWPLDRVAGQLGAGR